jgi:hypothetical protein
MNTYTTSRETDYSTGEAFSAETMPGAWIDLAVADLETHGAYTRYTMTAHLDFMHPKRKATWDAWMAALNASAEAHKRCYGA